MNLQQNNTVDLQQNNTVDLQKLLNFASNISRFNQNSISIETEYDWQIFQCIGNHVCTDITLDIKQKTEFKTSISSYIPLQSLKIITPLLEDFPYPLIRNQPNLQNFFFKVTW